jgi:hypothetical protein
MYPYVHSKVPTTRTSKTTTLIYFMRIGGVNRWGYQRLNLQEIIVEDYYALLLIVDDGDERFFNNKQKNDDLKYYCQHRYCHVINELDTSLKSWPNWVERLNSEKTKIGRSKSWLLKYGNQKFKFFEIED